MTATVGEALLAWLHAGSVDPALVETLETQERHRLSSLRNEQDRARYLGGRGLARVLVGAAAGLRPGSVRFESRCGHCGRSGHGKPIPAGPATGLQLSYSHSGSWVVAVLTVNTAVGVDVEQLSRDPYDEVAILELAALALSPAELAGFRLLSTDEQSVALYTTWTRKEALLKATGQGLALPPTSITVTPYDEPAAVLGGIDPGGGPPIWLHDLRPDVGHVGAVASLAGPLRLVDVDTARLLREAGFSPRPALVSASAAEPPR